MQDIVVNKHVKNEKNESGTTIGKRIMHIDGLRGLAITLVLCVHAYQLDFSLLPEMKKYSSFIIIQGGSLGVELFFMISGFVILMTLESCTNLREFLIRRWIRLFPAMLIATFFLFTTAPLISKEMHTTLPKLLDTIPGLTFTGASLWSSVLGLDVVPLSGVFLVFVCGS